MSVAARGYFTTAFGRDPTTTGTGILVKVEVEVKQSFFGSVGSAIWRVVIVNLWDVICG